MKTSDTFQILMLSTILLIASFSLLPFALGQQNEAKSEIEAAKNTLKTCFSEAQATEAAGANITELTTALNTAGALLSRAEFAYSAGDFTSAQTFSVRCQDELSSFFSIAASLKETALQEGSTDFMINVVFSILATIAVIIGSTVSWVLFKRKNERKDQETESAKA